MKRNFLSKAELLQLKVGDKLKIYVGDKESSTWRESSQFSSMTVVGVYDNVIRFKITFESWFENPGRINSKRLSGPKIFDGKFKVTINRTFAEDGVQTTYASSHKRQVAFEKI